MDKYCKDILVRVVAQICQTVGWQSINQSAYDVLVDIAHRYIREMCRKAHAYTELYNMTEPTFDHLNLMMSEMNINVTELKEYVDWIDPIALTLPVPNKLPVKHESHLNFLKPGSEEMLTRPVNIPEYLPPMKPQLEEKPDELISSNTLNVDDVKKESDDGLFKHPSIIQKTKVPAYPVVPDVDENFPIREIQSVMMTSSGFLSSSREGCLPESRIPDIVNEPAPKPSKPKPPKPQYVPAPAPVPIPAHKKKYEKYNEKFDKHKKYYTSKKRENNNSLSHNKNVFDEKYARKLARKEQRERLKELKAAGKRDGNVTIAHHRKSKLNNIDSFSMFNDISVIKQPFDRVDDTPRHHDPSPDIVIEIENEQGGAHRARDAQTKLNIFKKIQQKTKDLSPTKLDMLQRRLNTQAVNNLKHYNEIDIIPVQDSFKPHRNHHHRPLPSALDALNRNVEITKDHSPVTTPASVIDILKQNHVNNRHERYIDLDRPGNVSVERVTNNSFGNFPLSPEKLLQQRFPDATIQRVLDGANDLEQRGGGGSVNDLSDVFIHRVPDANKLDHRAQRHQATLQRLSETVAKRTSVESSIQKLPNTTIIKRLTDDSLQKLPGTSTSIQKLLPENISIQRLHSPFNDNVNVDRIDHRVDRYVPFVNDDRGATIHRMTSATIEKIPSANDRAATDHRNSPPDLSLEQAAARFLIESSPNRFDKPPVKISRNNGPPSKVKASSDRVMSLAPGVELTPMRNTDKVQNREKKHNKKRKDPPTDYNVESPTKAKHFKTNGDDDVTVISDSPTHDDIDLNAKPKTPEYRHPVTMPIPSFFPMFPSLPAGPGLIPTMDANMLPLFNFPAKKLHMEANPYASIHSSSNSTNPASFNSYTGINNSVMRKVNKFDDVPDNHVDKSHKKEKREKDKDKLKRKEERREKKKNKLERKLMEQKQHADKEKYFQREQQREQQQVFQKQLLEQKLLEQKRMEERRVEQQLAEEKLRQEKLHQQQLEAKLLREKRDKQMEDERLAAEKQRQEELDRKEKHRMKKLKKEKRKMEKEQKERDKEREQMDKHKEDEPTAVPKLTLKLTQTRSPTPDILPTKITIKAIRDADPGSPYVVHAREPSPELAKISALVTRPPKISKKHGKNKELENGGEKKHHHRKKDREKSKEAKESRELREPKEQSKISEKFIEPVPQPIPKLVINNVNSMHVDTVAPSVPVQIPAPVQTPVIPVYNNSTPPNPLGYVLDPEGNKVWICPACNGADDGSAMIGCDSCDAWYHWTCVGIYVPPDENENWYCRVCLAQKDQSVHASKKKKRKKKKKHDADESN